MSRQVVVICGSTRFKEPIEAAAKRETLRGNFVIAPHVYKQSGDVVSEQQVADLMQLHLDAVDIADELLVVDPEGYIGEATLQVVDHAYGMGVPVRRTSLGQ